jgi:hypothetical protein
MLEDYKINLVSYTLSYIMISHTFYVYWNAT